MNDLGGRRQLKQSQIAKQSQPK